MKATELRQNNLVTDEFYETFKTIIKVNSINDKGINLEIVDDGNWSEIAQRWIEPEYTFDKLRPIPLTEEILLKIKNVSLDEFNAEFGLRKIYKLGTGNLKFELNGNEVAVYFMDNLICFKKYLHQLQNMVYVNWDLELEINL